MNERWEPELVTSDRGFWHLLFEDAYGVKVKVYESSGIGSYEDAFDVPGSSALWVGLQDGSGTPILLSRGHVLGLIAAMSRWLGAGVSFYRYSNMAGEAFRHVIPSCEEVASGDFGSQETAT